MNKEIELWHFIAERLHANERAMLLVVAESIGSSPGRQGYKMAVGADGELIGSIGGGVMEVNLVEQSRKFLSEPSAVAHGLTSFLKPQIHQKRAENSSGMICSGKQTVIFKMLLPEDQVDVDRAVFALKKQRRDILALSPDLFAVSPLEGATHIADFVFEKRSETDFIYREKLGYKNELYIVGGGHCALALCELMSKMDFRISLFDDRPKLNSIDKNKFAHEIQIIDSYESIADLIPGGDNNYIVVMTLGYKTDETVITKLLEKEFKYFGVLGSKAKMATLMKNLKERGYKKEKLDRLHTPIGLPINSRTPEEIAVSIAAEIIAVKNVD